MRALCATLLLAMLPACTTLSQNAALPCGDAGPNTFYFPEGTFKPIAPSPRVGFVFRPFNYLSDDDRQTREWYSSSLDFLEQPSLSCGAIQTEETYRLVWLRSFHPSVAIQVTRSGSSYLVDVAMGNDKRKSGKPLRRIHRTLSSQEWRRIAAGLQKIDFWNLPANKQPAGYFEPKPPPPGAERDVVILSAQKDGAQWIIEGRTDRYHVIDRWSDADDVIAVGRIFIELSGLKIPDEDIY